MQIDKESIQFRKDFQETFKKAMPLRLTRLGGLEITEHILLLRSVCESEGIYPPLQDVEIEQCGKRYINFCQERFRNLN